VLKAGNTAPLRQPSEVAGVKGQKVVRGLKHRTTEHSATSCFL
jgi:hypothetical protein